MKKKKTKKVIQLDARKASLKRRLRDHLRGLGFQKDENGNLTSEAGKHTVRFLHSEQRRNRISASRTFIREKLPSLLQYFASGHEIDVSKITPVLKKVRSDTWEGDLFRLASLTWSVPVSNGFGRRLRYLVWDSYHNKLIGLIAIGDPVFNLAVRDRLIGWNAKDRGERLVNIMDAYVLGAVPPYNMLLGGKMVACLVRSKEIYADFTAAYGDTTGIISKQKKKARLLMVVTSSSMGRSSVYNRLKLDGTEYFEPVGYTGGWGHFHIPDKLFLDLRNFLRDMDHSYADLNEFGQGPNWRLRTTRAALSALGFKDDLLRHGVQREVFLCALAKNAKKILKTGKGRPNLSSLLSVKEISELAIKRWLLPRAERRPEYRLWKSEEIVKLLTVNHFSAPSSLIRLVERKVKNNTNVA